MARRSLVVDASVALRWFSAVGEAAVPQAVDILQQHVRQEIAVVVPDLLYYEVANGLAFKKTLSDDRLRQAVKELVSLALETVPVNAGLLAASVELARQCGITVYDACYVALARERRCPLITANPRHQGRALGCQVVPIQEWPGNSDWSRSPGQSRPAL